MQTLFVAIGVPCVIISCVYAGLRLFEYVEDRKQKKKHRAEKA